MGPIQLMGEQPINGMRLLRKRLKEKEYIGQSREIIREAVVSEIQENPTMSTRMLADNFECSHTAIENFLHKAANFSSLRLHPPFRFEVAKISFGPLLFNR